MKLCEHPDFVTLVLQTAQALDLPEQFVEKDYYMTEVLRIVAVGYPNQFIFRGGTALTKGWGLVDRFSEDLDLVLNRPYFDPSPGKGAARTKLRGVFEKVAEYPALSGDALRRAPEQRSWRYSYSSLFATHENIAGDVRLDIAAIAGTEPAEARMISSLVGEYATEIGAEQEADDTDPFEMQLLHFRRTFVEKLFAIHSYVARWLETEQFVAPTVRHYADLCLLSRQPEVKAMLQAEEYEKIRRDYDDKCKQAGRREYVSPPGLRFKDSEALFPDNEIRAFLEPIYNEQCQTLFNKSYPSFDAVLGRFEELRGLL